ncbi:MAG: polysaccharide biosynthesis tyrosine autokinase [bacterium]
MAQYDLNLRDVQRILRRRWKVVVFSTLLVVGFSYFFGKSRQPLYNSTSSVKIEETSTVAGLLLQRLTYSRWDNIATAQELIRSFPVMERVARRLGKIEPGLTSEQVRSDQEISARVNRMINQVTTERNGRTNIIDITVSSTDPHEARNIAQTLAEVFREVHLEDRSSQDRETREFIERQTRIAQNSLDGAEEKLQRFREQTKQPVLDDLVRSKVDELGAKQESLRKIQQQISQMETQLAQVRQRQSLGVNEVPDLSRPSLQKLEKQGELRAIDWFEVSDMSSALISLNDKLIELETKKRDLLRRFKPNAPSVIEVESEVQDILREITKEANDNLANLQKEGRGTQASIAALQTELEGVPESQRHYAQLQREVKLREEQYGMLSLKYQEALIREADQADEVSLVRPAMLNTQPINVNLNRLVTVGLVIGLALGLVLAFLFETFDTSIGTIEDVEEYLQVPVLGVIPSIDIDAVVEHLVRRNPSMENNPNLEASARLITHIAPKDPVAEGYRALRTAIQFRSISHPIRTITTTSASLQEGKSTTVVNLAITMAQGGTKVLLVGCNLRRPSLYKVFGIDQAPGVVDIVLGRMPWRETIKTVTDIIMGDLGMDSALMTPGMENLHIITSGGIPPNPSEMLVSKQMAQFIDEAKEEFDIVLFDAPPVLPVTDAAILAKRTDATLLIYRTGKVPRAALKRAKSQIESVGARVLGVVLNDLRAELVGYSGSQYYYGKYYGSSGENEVMSEKKGKTGGGLGRKLKSRLGGGLFSSQKRQKV